MAALRVQPGLGALRSHLRPSYGRPLAAGQRTSLLLRQGKHGEQVGEHQSTSWAQSQAYDLSLGLQGICKAE